MPAMKPVLQKYAPKILASTHGQTDPESYYMNDSLSKPTKRSQRVTDPYNISRDRDSKSDTESERRIIVAGSEEITVVGSKSPDTSSGGVMGASYNKKKSWSETITKTVEYGYEVDNASLPGHSSRQDEEAQMVRAKSPPRMWWVRVRVLHCIALRWIFGTASQGISFFFFGFLETAFFYTTLLDRSVDPSPEMLLPLFLLL
jgi:hypothetical protein